MHREIGLLEFIGKCLSLCALKIGLHHDLPALDNRIIGVLRPADRLMRRQGLAAHAEGLAGKAMFFDGTLQGRS